MQDLDSKIREKETSLSALESKFLKKANDPASRPSLLARLQELGLLPEFLEAENGTRQ